MNRSALLHSPLILGAGALPGAHPAGLQCTGLAATRITGARLESVARLLVAHLQNVLDGYRATDERRTIKSVVRMGV